MEISNVHATLPERTTAALEKNTRHKMIWLKTANGECGFECAPERVKEYLLTLATHVLVSEGSFFPNNINPSSVFSMSSFDWDELQDQGVAIGPSLCAILQHSACEEDRMSMLRDVLRTVMRDPEYLLVRLEVSRLLDLHLNKESLPIDKTEDLNNKVCITFFHHSPSMAKLFLSHLRPRCFL